MRSWTLASLLAISALAPVLVQAQEEDSTEADETDETEVADPPDSVKFSPTSGGRETAPGVVHTVESGDTLWDLSQKYLSNPWYWPKVWSYNPEIANPHWIYPGNRVRFFGSGEEAPAKVEEGGVETADSSVAEDVAPSTEMDTAEDLVTVGGKISFEPKAGRSVAAAGFVTAKELEEAGTIDSSFSGAQMLTHLDTVYVRFK